MSELTSGCHDNETVASVVQEDESMLWFVNDVYIIIIIIIIISVDPLSPRNYVQTLEIFSTEYITKISTTIEVRVTQWMKIINVLYYHTPDRQIINKLWLYLYTGDRIIAMGHWYSSEINLIFSINGRREVYIMGGASRASFTWRQTIEKTLWR